MKNSRIKNLDTLRAGAIIMVLLFHSTQLFADDWPWVWRFTKVGSFGVDLFFALSGYLVGSLFFMETNKNGRVNIPRFILRRLSRTVPAYFVALLLSYLAVYFYREESFDFGYLFFVQNYYQEIPFFFISWSLCVEEHFYLILPVFLSLCFMLLRQPSGMVVVILFLISLIPLGFRIAYQEAGTKPFGFYYTATHLNFDPLILGVAFAYISSYFSSVMTTLLKFKLIVYLVSILLLLSYSWWPVTWMYSVGAYLFGLSFVTTVAVSCEDKCWSISKIKLVSVIAVTSYAIYLTHVLSIHALEGIFEVVDLNNITLQLSLIVLIVFCVGYLFYNFIEQPILNWRSKSIASFRQPDQESEYANPRY